MATNELTALLAERDGILVALETRRAAGMWGTRRLLRRLEREIRAIDPTVLPGPVRWSPLPGLEDA